MSRKKTLFWIGMVIYAASFAVVALVDRASGGGLISGFRAAVFSIWVPLAFHPFQSDWPFHYMKVEYVALVISGLINPLFLVILTLAAMGYQQAVAILRIILLLMIPFCWVVFYSHPLYPREGHFLWVLGMVLALFSGFLQAGSHSDWEECPWCSGRDYNCPQCAGTGWILVRDEPKLRKEIRAKRSSKNR